jgi:hypothetical protein
MADGKKGKTEGSDYEKIWDARRREPSFLLYTSLVLKLSSSLLMKFQILYYLAHIYVSLQLSLCISISTSKLRFSLPVSFTFLTMLPKSYSNLGSVFFNRFLGAFAKLPKATISFVTSVRLSAWNNSAPIGQIFIKFDI